jgi:NNP family nitrate/nitrite transporter-like MFS transporter
MSTDLTQPAANRWKTLNLAWIAFFLTFVVWFNLAPFKSTVARAFGLTTEQVTTLMICNVALTIPARILVGMLVDRFGPKRVYAGLLLAVSLPCFGCAMATEYWQLVVGRLLVSCVGAGFVVGIRLVGEWFDAREIGWAEGIYGGLGNFGMAAATFGLPLLAVAWGGTRGWRWAMAMSGFACIVYAFVFFKLVTDTPEGRVFRRPKKKGAMEVCSRGDLLALAFMQVPMVFCMGVLTWKLVGVKLISPAVGYGIYAVLVAVLVQQVAKIIRVNRSALHNEPVPVDERYSFSQVAILCLCYAVTFGGELAVESMLPAYFEKMFDVSVSTAGMMGAGFAFASLVARPLGGLLGDRYGRRPIMIISLAGSAVGFFAIGTIGRDWSIGAAMTVVIAVGFFLMAANGANFCIAPLIRKPLTGQIAGLIGAYGNVGSVLFLLVFSLGGPGVFFISMGVTGAIAFLCTFLLIEPARSPALARTVATTAEAEDAEPILGGLTAEPA